MRRRARVPFAAPLSAVDRVEVLRRDDGRAVELSADKAIDPKDPYMPAHFPGFTIYPGVFIVETVLQAVALAGGASDHHVPTIASVRHLRFLAPLLRNDTLSCSVSITPVEPPELHDVVAQVRRGDGRVAARMDCEIRFDAHGPGTR
jgi:3-hydroxyacyl-[acyl-carrier-protein] dehydratase